MEDCVFCKIVKGELPCHKVYEDDDFLAFLAITPNTKGMTILTTKKHYGSYIFDLPDDVYHRFLLTAKKVGKLLDEKLGTQRTALVMEGMGVNHAHFKLYPLHGLTKEWKRTVTTEKEFFEKYIGYISTKPGSRMDDNQLKQLAKKIRGED